MRAQEQKKSAGDIPKWLIMVYMQAGDTSNLDSLGVQDLLEIEEGLRKNPNVSVLVQMQRRWPGVPQRYFLEAKKPPVSLPADAAPWERSLVTQLPQPEPDPKVEKKNVNMGTSEALEEFLKLRLDEKYNATHCCLILWGHAFGLGFGRDHHDPLTLSELREALNKGFDGNKLDVLATNACTMSYIEAAFELRRKVNYLVASQVFVPLTGLPYQSILRSIDSSTGPEDLSKLIVDRYVEAFANSSKGEKVAMAALNLGKAEDLRTLLDDVAQRIAGVIGLDPNINFERLAEIRDIFLANPAGDVRPVLDLGSLADDLTDLCDSWRAMGGEADLRNAARKLRDAVQLEGSERFMIHHNEHADLKDGMSGVGVFAPFVVDKSFLKQLELDDVKGRGAYKKLQIFNDEDGKERDRWVSLVYDDLSLDRPDELVDETGVVRPAERRQVNQLVSAIEASFNKLDRVLKSAKDDIVADLKTKKRSDPAIDVLSKFGPPHLRLSGGWSLLSDKELTKAGILPSDSKSQAAPLRVVSILKRIETAVGLVEKATKRVTTNRTYGLGPPTSAIGPLHLGAQPGEDVLGSGDPKEAGDILGSGDPKEAGDILGSGDPKEAGDILGRRDLGSDAGALLAFLASDAQVAGLAVKALFARIASSLRQMERAAAGIEAVAARFLFLPKFGERLSFEDYDQTVKDQFAQAFDVMSEVSLQARKTIRRVLSHPVYGLGPGPEGLGQAERDELATVAGLNRRKLALL